MAGIAELFRASAVQGWEEPHTRLSAQVSAYCDWARKSVLPRARATPTLPAELYADRLKQVGVDITPEQAIALGTTAFAEAREAMTQVSAAIARERNLPSADYRQVLRALKREVIAPERLLDLYKQRLAEIEALITREKLVTLPQRAAAIRLASERRDDFLGASHVVVARAGMAGEYFASAGRVTDALYVEGAGDREGRA